MGEENKGFYAIMNNFNYERFLDGGANDRHVDAAV